MKRTKPDPWERSSFFNLYGGHNSGIVRLPRKMDGLFQECAVGLRAALAPVPDDDIADRLRTLHSIAEKKGACLDKGKEMTQLKHFLAAPNNWIARVARFIASKCKRDEQVLPAIYGLLGINAQKIEATT